MSWLLTIGGIILLVLLHELGHFATAKAVGMRVERFSLFFPPTIASVRVGETEYAIGALPLGGYVKIAGMSPPQAQPVAPGGGGGGGTGNRRTADGGAGEPAHATARAGLQTLVAAPEAAAPPGPLGSSSHAYPTRYPSDFGGFSSDGPATAPADDPRGYFRQPVWKRVLVIAAGPAVNVLIAFLILWGIYGLSAQTPVPHRVNVAGVQAHRPADGVLRKGDKLLAVDGVPVALKGENFNFIGLIGAHGCAGQPTEGCLAATPVKLTILRDGHRITVSVRPAYDSKLGRMAVGFQSEPLYRGESVAGAAGASLSEMWHVTSVTVTRIGSIFTSEKARNQIHGIVGVSDVVSQEFSYSTTNALFVLALLSLSLAIVNLFPFLPLDGGHIFWALAEKVRGRAIPFAVMERASMIGVFLVICLFFLGLTNDVHSLSNGSLTVHR
jgi:regulator of sigma E protease